MPAHHSNVVIANGESESAEIDLTGQVLVAIHLPSAWTAATVTLLAADASGGSFGAVHDADGEVEFTIAANEVQTILPDVTRGLRYVKIRSGNKGAAVNQGGARTLVVTTLEDDRA